MNVYATTTQFAVWIDTPQLPAGAAALLRSASLVVAKACNRDPYTDIPSDADGVVLADATCAQAATWLALGVDPAKVGTDVRVVVESKIATRDIKYDALTAAQVAEAALALAPEAESILQSAGLLWQPLPQGAPADDRLEHFGLDDPYLFPAIYVP